MAASFGSESRIQTIQRMSGIVIPLARSSESKAQKQGYSKICSSKKFRKSLTKSEALTVDVGLIYGCTRNGTVISPGEMARMRRCQHLLNQRSQFLSLFCKGAINLSLCLLTGSWVKVRNSGTSFSVFSDELSALLVSVLPFLLIVWFVFVLYLYTVS